jgi:hypothetical protein
MSALPRSTRAPPSGRASRDEGRDGRLAAADPYRCSDICIRHDQWRHHLKRYRRLIEERLPDAVLSGLL